MSDRRFTIVCTGRGEHGRIEWPSLTLADDGTIRQSSTRPAPSPVRGIVEGDVDGEQVPLYRKAVVPVEDHRSERGTWRWKCRRCGIDRPLSEDRLRAWMNATTADVLDISQLPR